MVQRCVFILSWSDTTGSRRDMTDVNSSSNTLFTFRKSWVLFFLFKQLCFTITHTEFLLCWHTWNYCTGCEPPGMTENRKIWLGSVKGDTPVTELQRLVLASEWTECQLRSLRVVKTNESINSRSLHIKCTKSIWHLARNLWVVNSSWVCGMNTCIYSFYVFNDVHVLCANNGV